jgi:hypothetical protein
MNANTKAEGLNTTLLSLSLRKARRFTFHGGKETFLQLMFMPVMNRNACHFTCRRSANICVHRGNFIDEVYQTTVSTKELFN